MDNFKMELARRFGVELSCIEKIEDSVWRTNELESQIIKYKDSVNYEVTLPINLFVLNLFGKPRLLILQYFRAQDTNKAPELTFANEIVWRYNINKGINIPYWYATNNGHWGFFSDADKSIKDGEFKTKDLDALFLVESNKEVHDACLGLLKKMYQVHNVLFSFRRDTKGLNQGYWFDGEVEGKSEESCILSFWEGYDTVANTPNIYFEILRSGTVRLVLSAKDNKLKQSFFEDNLVSNLRGFDQKIENGKKVPIWHHLFATNWKEDYIKILEDFSYEGKDSIDNYLKISLNQHKKNLGDINFINPEKFASEFNRVLELQDRLESGETLSIDFAGLSEFGLKLKTLHLENIGHFKHFEIDLSKRVICLLGENGSGKTTILRALLLALTGVDQTIELKKQEKSIKQLLRIEGKKNGKIKYATHGNISVVYELDSVYENNISFYKPESSEIFQISDVYSKDRNSFALTHQNYYSHLILGFPQMQSTEKRNNGGFRRPNIYDALPLLNNEPREQFEELQDWIFALDGDNKPNNSARQTKGWERVYAKEEDIIKLVFKIVSEITQVDQRNIIEFDAVNHIDGIIWVKIIDENSEEVAQIVPFDLISQGFKNVFAWVGHIIKRMVESNDYQLGFENKYALILIDEIDTYLHPKWQRHILNTLAKHFPNTQFIISTHSPLVMSYLKDVPREDRALYVLRRNQEQPELYTHTYGRGIQEIFWDWMGIAEYPGEVQEKITDVLKLIDEGTTNSLETAESMYNALLQNMNSTDAIMVEIKLSLDMAKEYLKMEDEA